MRIICGYFERVRKKLISKDGAELMIESGWLEKIPETANRKELMN